MQPSYCEKFVRALGTRRGLFGEIVGGESDDGNPWYSLVDSGGNMLVHLMLDIENERTILHMGGDTVVLTLDQQVELLIFREAS